MSCFDKEPALYALSVLKSLVKADVRTLEDSDRIVFGNRGAEIRKVRNRLRTHTAYEERLSAAQRVPQLSSFTSVADTAEHSRVPSRPTITFSRSIRKVFLTHDAYRVGWLLDGCASKCFACKHKFSAVVRRHHCRACGNIFCARCTDRHISVMGIPLRACVLCHVRFNTRTTWTIADFLVSANAYEESDNRQSFDWCTPKLFGVAEEVEAENEVGPEDHQFANYEIDGEDGRVGSIGDSMATAAPPRSSSSRPDTAADASSLFTIPDQAADAIPDGIAAHEDVELSEAEDQVINLPPSPEAPRLQPAARRRASDTALTAPAPQVQQRRSSWRALLGREQPSSPVATSQRAGAVTARRETWAGGPLRSNDTIPEGRRRNSWKIFQKQESQSSEDDGGVGSSDEEANQRRSSASGETVASDRPVSLSSRTGSSSFATTSAAAIG